MNQTVSKLPMSLLLATLLSAALAFVPLSNAMAAEDVVSKTVSAPFAKVVTNLKREITGHKLVIVKEVPYQKMVKMVGVKSGPMMGFEIFHPRYGKVIHQKDASAFLEVPLRILVRESGGKVELRYRKPSAVFASYSGLSGLGKQLDEVLADIVARVTK